MGTPMPSDDLVATTASLLPTPTDEELEAAITLWWEASAAIEHWSEVKDGAASVILAAVPTGSSRGGVQVARGRRRFSPENAARNLTMAQFASICEYAPSPKLAREKLSQADLERCYADGGSSYVRRST